jgi:hypothetical protein
MNDITKFFAYRYFLVPNEQISIFQQQIREKNLLIREVFKELESKNKLSKILGDRKYLLYFYNKISDDIYVCKFAKETHFVKYEEGDIDINNINDSEYPFIYIIVDLSRQIILFEHKPSIFRTPTASKYKFIEWITTDKDMFDYNLKIDEITYEHAFWDYIERSDSIYEIVLNMKSPNLFDGWLEANNFLKMIKELFNNTESEIKLSNEKGKLVIDKKYFETFIRYITGGGGYWRLKAKIQNSISTFRSRQNIKIVNVATDIIENVEKFGDIIKDKLNKVEDILDFKKDSENSHGDKSEDH